MGPFVLCEKGRIMITPIKPISNPFVSTTFQGKNKRNVKYREGDTHNPDLKQLWDRGKLPEVKFGFYGDELTYDNISREHLIPKCQGGTKRFGNIVLASKIKNNGRSDKDIRLFATIETVKKYLKQFENIHILGFEGPNYIREVKKTLKILGMMI